MTLVSPGICAFRTSFRSPVTVLTYTGRGTLTKDFLSAAGIMRFPAGDDKPQLIFMMVRL